MKSDEVTTIHVRRSHEGDPASVAWLIEHFTPALLTQARYRLGRHLREHYDPEDLVQDAWMAVLPRIGELRPRDGRLTPVLMRFLSTAVLHRYGTLMKKYIAGKPLRVRASDEPTFAGAEVALTTLPADQTGIVTRAVRRELASRILEEVEQLSEGDREVLVLRSIEQVSLSTAAKLLGITENAVSVRHHRALSRLREKLPTSVFADLPEA